MYVPPFSSAPVVLARRDYCSLVLFPNIQLTQIGLQSILFTIVWRALSESTYFKTMVKPNYEDDDGKMVMSSYLSFVLSVNRKSNK